MATWNTTAGKYKTRVVIQTAVETVNAIHEVAISWIDSESRWAQIAPTSGREFQAAMQVIPIIQSIVRVRSDNLTRAMTSKSRIKIGERILNIAAIYDETNERREVVLWCVEGG
jgi:SPP1 family predicted phage head-tail adaptor